MNNATRPTAARPDAAHPNDRGGGDDAPGLSAPPPGASFGKGMSAPFAPGGTLDTLGRASLMGLHLVSGMIVGALLGYGLDRWIGIFPWCSGIGLLFGIVAGFRTMWAEARALIGQSERSGGSRRVDDDAPRS